MKITGLTALVRTSDKQIELEAKGIRTKLVSAVRVEMSSAEDKAMAKFLDEQAAIGNDPSRQLVGVIADNDPRNLWGEIVKNGKIVARIYNSGGIETEHDNVHLNPKASTAERAQQVLDQLGGELVMANVRKNYYTSHHLVPTCDWLGVVW